MFVKYWKTLGEQFSHWSQSVWLHVREILFVKPYFLQQHSNPAKKLVNVIFLDFCKDFCNVSHSVLLDKISSPQLGDGVTRWVNTKGYSEGVTSGWQLPLVGFCRDPSEAQLSAAPSLTPWAQDSKEY